MNRPLLLLVSSFLVLACASAETAPPPPELQPLPRASASALCGVVRALEALAAARPADCVVEVRAVAAEVRLDSKAGRMCESVTLDLSVFAATVERAREAFDGLRGTLEAEGAAVPRVELASPERVRAALAELGPRAGGEALLSYSDRLRLELAPGTGAAPTGAPEAELEYATLESYVRSRAAEIDSVGQVELQHSGARAAGPRDGVRVLLAPGMNFQRYRMDQIGVFLADLENDSPAVRVTQLAIERSSHEPDTENPRGWTFTAELTVRAREGGR